MAVADTLVVAAGALPEPHHPGGTSPPPGIAIKEYAMTEYEAPEAVSDELAEDVAAEATADETDEAQE